MKAYFKSTLRSIKSNITRFISIIVIMLLGIAFVGGLGSISQNFKDSFSDRMNADRFADIVIKCKEEKGFSAETLALIEGNPLVEEISTLTSADFREDGNKTRIYIYDDLETKVNRLTIEGRLPRTETEVMVERASNAIGTYALNDKITLFGMPIEYTVVGIVSNPQIFDMDGEPFIDSDTGETDGYLEKIVYMDRSRSLLSALPTTDAHVRLAGLGEREYFSKSYVERVQVCVDSLKTLLGEENYAFLTVKDNKSYLMIENYCDKISVITLVFPAFFIAVAALVVTTTVSRMVEEDRAVLGCLKSLGISDWKIIAKYLLLGLLCCLVAVLVGLPVGLAVLPNIIYPAFKTLFFLPAKSATIYPLSGFLAFVATTAAVLAVTYFVCRASLKEKPAALLTAKAPKAGKKILLERIPFLWKPLSFKYKSSIRNIFGTFIITFLLRLSRGF